MKSSVKLRALTVGVLALASGSAMANTNLNFLTSGTIFVDLWDQTNGNTFVYDTGLTQSSFNGDTSVVNTNLSSDPNYQAFISGLSTGTSLASTTDNVTYNVISVGPSGEYTTGSGAPTGFVFNAKTNTAGNNGGAYEQAVNGTSSTTTNSEFASSATASSSALWGNTDAGWNLNLKVSSDSSLGSALNFYSIAFGAGSKTSNTIKSVVTTFDGTWLLTAAGALTYGVAGGTPPNTPIPAPFGLLLGGLALMGVIARRGKSGEGDISGAAA